MGKEVKSDGIITTISDNGSTQTISDANYSADTKNTSKIHSQSGRIESATSRNIEINGNSQEYCWARGITCESNVKVVGNPEQFEGSILNKIHDSLSELASLLVQRGDNSRSLSLPGLPKIDYAKITSTMSSSLSASLSPPTPNIKTLDDIATYAAEFESWASQVNAANVAERSARAAALQAERTQMQQKLNVDGALGGSSATQDLGVPEYNTDRKTVYGTTDMEYITNLERYV